MVVMDRWVVLLLLAAVGTGCSHELRMRANRFVSPEAQGRGGGGQIQFQTSAAHVLELPEFPSEVGQPSQFLSSDPTYEMATSLGLGKRVDIGVLYEFPDVSAGFGGKVQFLGEGRKTSKPGNFSLSGTLAPAFNFYSSDLSGTGDKLNRYILGVDTSLIAGYRVAKPVLLYGGPFYTYYGSRTDYTYQGVDDQANERGDRFGVHFGSRFEWKFMALTLEVSWSHADWEGVTDDLFALGGAFAFYW
jgi:hypothetical protein